MGRDSYWRDRRSDVFSRSCRCEKNVAKAFRKRESRLNGICVYHQMLHVLFWDKSDSGKSLWNSERLNLGIQELNFKIIFWFRKSNSFAVEEKLIANCLETIKKSQRQNKLPIEACVMVLFGSSRVLDPKDSAYQNLRNSIIGIWKTNLAPTPKRVTYSIRGDNHSGLINRWRI